MINDAAPMMYVSTRGGAPKVSFEDALLAGLAPDGGLYLPESWPSLDHRHALTSGSYQDAAAAIMSPYLGGDLHKAELASLLEAAYANFDGPDIAPLRPAGPGLFILELFHGPTLSFKDFAMQVLSRLLERALARRGGRATILGATSGDTGAAAVEAFRGRQGIALFVLFPHGRVSEVQRRQMTAAAAGNVHIVAIEGTFDDAQAIVKQLFGDKDFRRRHALSAINSINWARVMAQIVYYFTASAKLGGETIPSFSVPTGNFGDIFAGYGALRMGLPIGRLVIATNENDILRRALETGRYEPRGVVATDSPSMDIQVSSNFERLLFEACGHDANLVRRSMSRLGEDGGFDIPPSAMKAIRLHFSAHRVSREEAALAMKSHFAETGTLIDPHTAVGLAAAKKESAAGPMVVLATAHAAKFPDAVRRATGQMPALPAKLAASIGGAERYAILPNSAAAVAAHIEARGLFSRSRIA